MLAQLIQNTQGVWLPISILIVMIGNYLIITKKMASEKTINEVINQIFRDIKKLRYDFEDLRSDFEILRQDVMDMREEVYIQREAREFKLEIEMTIKKILDYNQVPTNSELRTWITVGGHEAAKYAERLILQGLKKIDTDVMQGEMKGILKDLRNIVNVTALRITQDQMIYIEEKIVKPEVEQFVFNFLKIQNELTNSVLTHNFQRIYLDLIQNVAIKTIQHIKLNRHGNEKAK